MVLVRAATRRASPPFLLGTLLLLAGAPASAQCPSSAVTLPVVGEALQSTAETFTLTGSEGSSGLGDHRVGQFSLHHSGLLSPTVVLARDRFEVTGVPPGTPVAMTMKFKVSGWTFTDGCGGSGCCGMLVATLRHGADTTQTTFTGATFSGRSDFSGELDLPITIVAGATVDLEAQMWARRCPGGSHTVDATGVIVFEGTDPSAAVLSCKGFGPQAVPVQRRNWGSLKAIYR